LWSLLLLVAADCLAQRDRPLVFFQIAVAVRTHPDVPFKPASLRFRENLVEVIDYKTIERLAVDHCG